VDYHVKFIVTDGGDNSISFEKKINGVFGGFLDFLGDIWNTIVGAVTAAVKAVVEVLNAIRNWVLDRLVEMLRPIIQGINGISSSEVERLLADDAINGSISIDYISSLITGGAKFIVLLMASQFYISALKMIPVICFALPFIATGIISLSDVTATAGEMLLDIFIFLFDISGYLFMIGVGVLEISVGISLLGTPYAAGGIFLILLGCVFIAITLFIVYLVAIYNYT